MADIVLLLLLELVPTIIVRNAGGRTLSCPRCKKRIFFGTPSGARPLTPLRVKGFQKTIVFLHQQNPRTSLRADFALGRLKVILPARGHNHPFFSFFS